MNPQRQSEAMNESSLSIPLTPYYSMRSLLLLAAENSVHFYIFLLKVVCSDCLFLFLSFCFNPEMLLELFHPLM